MKKIIGLILVLLLAEVLFVDIARSENHRIEILKTASLNGVQLKPGVYRLDFNGTDEVKIFRGRKLLVTAGIELVPLANASPNSIVQASTGELKEIRLSKQRVVFNGPLPNVQAQR